MKDPNKKSKKKKPSHRQAETLQMTAATKES